MVNDVGCQLGIQNKTRIDNINGDINEIKSTFLRLEAKIETVQSVTLQQMVDLRVEMAKPQGPGWAVTIVISLLSSGFLGLAVYALTH